MISAIIFQECLYYHYIILSNNHHTRLSIYDAEKLCLLKSIINTYTSHKKAYLFQRHINIIVYVIHFKTTPKYINVWLQIQRCERPLQQRWAPGGCQRRGQRSWCWNRNCWVSSPLFFIAILSKSLGLYPQNYIYNGINIWVIRLWKKYTLSYTECQIHWYYEYFVLVMRECQALDWSSDTSMSHTTTEDMDTEPDMAAHTVLMVAMDMVPMLAHMALSATHTTKLMFHCCYV